VRIFEDVDWAKRERAIDLLGALADQFLDL
jgi:hypothetical protein